MPLVPLGDNVIIKRLEPDKQTKGGIMLPDVALDKPQRGRVLATGPGKMLEDGTTGPMHLKDGDTVLFKKWGDHEVEFENEKFVVVGQDDILAKIE